MPQRQGDKLFTEFSDKISSWTKEYIPNKLQDVTNKLVEAKADVTLKDGIIKELKAKNTQSEAEKGVEKDRRVRAEKTADESSGISKQALQNQSQT